MRFISNGVPMKRIGSGKNSSTDGPTKTASSPVSSAAARDEKMVRAWCSSAIS